MEDIDGAVGITHQDAFGQFQLQMLRCKVRLVQYIAQGAEEIGAVKLKRRQVDRHTSF